VINQTYEDWGMIIIDSCFTDSSKDIARKLESKNN